MGMYTALEVKCTVKPKILPFIQKLHETHHWAEILEGAPLSFQAYALNDRADFIPFGVQCVWKSGSGSTGDGFARLEGNTWHFECSLKNYCGEIEQFLNHVLPNIAETLEICRKQYEEDQEDTHFILVDGKVVQKERLKDRPRQ